MERKKVDDIEIWFDEFRKEKEYQGLAQATLDDYAWTLHLFLTNTNGTLDKDSIYQFIDYFKSRGSVKSINHHLANLRVFVNYCKKCGYCDSQLVVKLQKQNEPKVCFYTPEECQKLLEKPLAKASFREWRTYVMINLLLATGCRLSSLTNITLSDLDFETKELTYRHLKTKKFVLIPMSSTLIYTIRTYLKMWDVKEYLFCDYNNLQMTRNSVRLSMEVYFKKREVEFKGIHTFRHTFARMWILNGGDPFTLQQMLCHQDLTMTRRYVNLFGSDLHGSLERYSPLDALKKDDKVRRK